MSIQLEVWEDSGPILSGRGTNQNIVNNVGHKDSPLVETYNFGNYPVLRPSPGSVNSDQNFAASYHKYTSFKISGTYPTASRLRVWIEGSPDDLGDEDGVVNSMRLIYKMTNVYSEPTNDMLSGTVYHTNNRDLELLPLVSNTGPDTATTFPTNLVSDATYYTNYLVTQLYVDPSVWDDFGNIPDIRIKFSLVDYETSDL